MLQLCDDSLCFFRTTTLDVYVIKYTFCNLYLSFRKKKCYYIHVILYSYRKSCATLICSNDLLENFNLPTYTISHSFSISYSFYTETWKVNSIKLYTQSRFLVDGWNIAENSATYMFVHVFVYVHISTFIISDEN